jgi:hypothetical protein
MRHHLTCDCFIQHGNFSSQEQQTSYPRGCRPLEDLCSKGTKGPRTLLSSPSTNKLFIETMVADASANCTLPANSSAVAIIAAVFTSSDEVIDCIPDEAGIVPVPYPDLYDDEAAHTAPEHVPSNSLDERDQDLDVEHESASAKTGTERKAPTPEASALPTESGQLPPIASVSYRPNYRADSQARSARPSINTFNTPASSTVSVLRETIPSPFTVDSTQTEYRRLINSVIAAARNKRGGFLSRGSFNLDALLMEASRDLFTCDLPFGVRNDNQLSHDMKVVEISKRSRKLISLVGV